MSDKKLSKAQEKILEALDDAANIYSGDFNFEFGDCTEIDCGEETWDMKVTHEDFDWLFLSFPVRGKDGDIFPQMDFHEDHWEEITQEQFFTYAFFESATQIAQLTAQLAHEKAERKRLEENETAMVAWHDELERMLAEADEAIVEHAVQWVEAGDGHGPGYECRHCGGWARGEVYEVDTIEHEHNEPCIVTKAKSRIEARR